MKKLKVHRHGEILFVETKAIPKKAKETKTNTLLVGSGQNPHTFSGGTFYELKDGDYIFGYFKAKDTKLYHKEHGDKKNNNLLMANLPNGNYELRRQYEYINNELKQVID